MKGNWRRRAYEWPIAIMIVAGTLMVLWAIIEGKP